eukprot:m.167767 g.167767  ORF g.167767 m.167767 type:complete len:455 (-) comp21136_c0_seq4:48-1412(-)
MGESQVEFCWRRTQGRTAGTPLQCAPGLEEDAGLCYPPCQSGYTGVSFVCWQDCPAGFADTGVDCLKPPAYGRGAGYVIWDHGECESQNPQGCSQNGLLWYPNCRPGFHNVGCCICSPDCPDGMTDIGVSCQKNTYTRTAGQPISTCYPPLQKDGALCYPQCPDGFTGVGPVCWQECPEFINTNCGAGCAQSSDQCAKSVFDMVESVFQFALKVVELALSDGASGAASVAESVAKSTLENAVTAATHWAASAIAADLPAVKAQMQAAYNLARQQLASRYSAPLLALLETQYPADLAQQVVNEAIDTVAQASLSSSSYNLMDFLEATLPLDIGDIIKAYDQPLCDPSILPTTCSDFPSVCTSQGLVCGDGWTCQGQSPQPYIATQYDATAPSSASSSSSSSKGTVVAGAVLGTVVGVMLLVLVGMYAVKLRKGHELARSGMAEPMMASHVPEDAL